MRCRYVCYFFSLLDMRVWMWFLRFLICFILICMLILEIKFCSVDLFICFLIFIVLINIVVFFNFLVNLVILWFKDLCIIDLGFSIVFKLERDSMIFRKEVIRSIIWEIKLIIGKVSLIRDNI